MKAIVFPGQGSQRVGMGSGLFEKYPDIVRVADQVLGYSIADLCIDDKNAQLGSTAYTQPALFVVNALHYHEYVREQFDAPAFLLGHSLGEYNALLAAEVFDFETGLKLVKKRGELMSRVHEGGMAAVVGLTKTQVMSVLDENGLDCIDIANINGEFQIVISGPASDIKRAKVYFEACRDIKAFVELPVSGPFHSRYMCGAQEEFAIFIRGMKFSAPRIPVVSNLLAIPYQPHLVADTLAKQISGTVKWNESVRYLLNLGVNDLVEVGPQKILTNLVKKIKAEFSASIGTEVSTKASPVEKCEDLKRVQLGCPSFIKAHKLKFAYVGGGMANAISSEALVIRMAKAGLLSFYGTDGLPADVVEAGIVRIKHSLRDNQSWGMNIVRNFENLGSEEKLFDLCFKHKINKIEVSSYTAITEALVAYRLTGVSLVNGHVIAPNMVMAKVTRLEVAEAFMTPPPAALVQQLLAAGRISPLEASLASKLPVADDVCVAADSAGHTDMATAYAIVPAVLRLRDELQTRFRYAAQVRVGCGGGIGSPEAALASFIMGADFIMTGSINQCTVEAGTSPVAKLLLQNAEVQDTTYVTAGEFLGLNSKIQVLKKGVFFPSRASKIHDLLNSAGSLEGLDASVVTKLEERYFKASLSSILDEIVSYYSDENPAVVERVKLDSRYRLELVYRWYILKSRAFAIHGDEGNRINFQIYCSPAMGAFNQWVKGTKYESWRSRHVDEIGVFLMEETEKLLHHRLQKYVS